MTASTIHLDGVRKAYGVGKGRQEVLRGVSLDINEGELVALVGQSGSGKSTLLNIIGGLDRADAGEVNVVGQPIGTLGDGPLARLRNQKIGFIFQAFHLLDHLTCLENVYLPAFFSDGGLHGAEARALDALGRVGLRDFAKRRPTELSGGQKQRVAIARALLNRPALMLCDEPTGNLDSETGRDVIKFFQELNREDRVTMVIVTHEERVSSAARRVVRIADGRIVSDGATDTGPVPGSQENQGGSLVIKFAPLARILRQNLRRNLRHIILSSIGIVLGIAAFVFFWGLSEGVSRVVLHDIFPIDRIEVVAPKTSQTGATVTLDDALVNEIKARPEVREAFPKMEMRFPASGQGGFGNNSFRFEVAGFCDAMDPELLKGDAGMEMFKDWEAAEAGKMAACAAPVPDQEQCPDFYYCAADNLCHHRVPVLVGRTLVELYNASFAPSHNLPKIGKVQEAALKGVMKTLHFSIKLGESVFQGAFGAPKAPPEIVEAMPVGISAKAMPLGMTVPIGYMRRWNARWAGPESVKSYSSIVVDLKDRGDLGTFVAWVHQRGYENAESQAERISLVMIIVTALFVVIAFSIMFISAVNISHTFFMIVSERRREIGLLRALGASRFDVAKIILGEAAVIGFIGGTVGVGAALGVARLIDFISTAKLPDYPYKPNTYFSFSPALVGIALGFAILFCVLGAALPARRATKIHPAQALSG